MQKPEIVVIAGPNGSGKSTFTEFIVGPNQFADESFEYINADDIQRSTNCEPLEAAIMATEKRETACEKEEILLLKRFFLQEEILICLSKQKKADIL